MNDELELKTRGDGYDPAPFYFAEETDNFSRFVAWTSSSTQLRDIVYLIIDLFPSELELLLKIHGDPEIDDADWHRYYGKTTRTKLVTTLSNNEVCAFEDGGNQLCIRRSDTGEYITLDDHSILFMYTNSKAIEEVLKSSGLIEGKNDLINGVRHWHYVPEDVDRIRSKFINQLHLREID